VLLPVAQQRLVQFEGGIAGQEGITVVDLHWSSAADTIVTTFRPKIACRYTPFCLVMLGHCILSQQDMSTTVSDMR